MSPNNREFETPIDGCAPAEPAAKPYTPQYRPTRVYLAIIVHLFAVYALYLAWYEAQWKTLIFAFLSYGVGGLGMTAGAHRLWSHRAYKARLPLQVILALFNTLALQDSVIIFARNHRSHHKFSDTDADPHNSKRGFFFSHMGWLLMDQHPDVKRKGQGIDLSDLYSNPVVKFQHDNYPILGLLVGVVLPTLITLLWGESLNVAWHINLLGHVVGLHASLTVNSVTHIWGTKPYDETIAATQCTLLSIAALGEAYHNYHHVFPFDYRAAELGNNKLNFTTLFIDVCVWLGWAYDVKMTNQEMVQARMKKSGDGSNLWGY